MGSKKLVFDVDVIDGMKIQIDTTADYLKDTKTSTVQLILDLRMDWLTPAGKQMLETIDNEWSKDVDKYVKTLEVLSSLLNEAKTHYETVQQEVDKLKL